MKLIGHITSILAGKLEFEFYGLAEAIDLTKKYVIEIKEYKAKRSNDQNALAWLHIERLAKETGNDKWEIYKQALKEADVSAEYIIALPETEKSLREVYRVVEVLDETREVKGKQLTIFKCYIGSSKLNTKEFTKFVEYINRKCAENGIIIELE